MEYTLIQKFMYKVYTRWLTVSAKPDSDHQQTGIKAQLYAVVNL